MIGVIAITEAAGCPFAGGPVRTVLGFSRDGTRVEVVVVETEPGKTWRLARATSRHSLETVSQTN